MSQPIIRGIQAVGAVDIIYRYNASNYKLTAAAGMGGKKGINTTSAGVSIAGFKLDQEFLRANPQIASSIVQPLLGGGGIALTNNNRTGTLVLNCSKVALPNTSSAYEMSSSNKGVSQGLGITPPIGAKGNYKAYDLVSLAQCQQAQPGGDSYGATILIKFEFCGIVTVLQFEACTVASVDPIGLAGNNVPDYQVSFNYLNWGVGYGAASNATIGVIDQAGNWTQSVSS